MGKTFMWVSRTAANPGAGRQPSALRRLIGLFLGLAVFATLLAMAPPADLAPMAWRVAAVGALMAVWWVVEAIPVAATALVPLALLPLLDVVPVKTVAASYANPLIFLFLGGFMIALAMERWNLHRRIALHILRWAGARPARMTAGFMGATAFLSMWVSNTATATMMLPIGLSVIALLQGADDITEIEGPPDNFAIGLLLGIAAAANIGGTATLIGTPPNALLAGLFEETYGRRIGFGEWLALGLPFAMVMLAGAWLLLTRLLYRMSDTEMRGAAGVIDQELARLGPVTLAERLVAGVLGLTALAWIVRPLLNQWPPLADLSDPVIAVLAGLVLFAIPVKLGKGTFLLDWTATRRLPWGVLLLVGGGLALGESVNASGLSSWLADALAGAAAWPTVGLIAGVAGVVMLVSHFASNTATAATFLPVIATLATSVGQPPLLLAVPAVLAASCAFMMPVATPPNAIVFASGLITVPQMARAGLLINLLALGLIVVLSYTLMPLVFGVGAW